MRSRCFRPLALLAALSAAAFAQQNSYNFQESQIFLNTYCQKCHPGKSGAGGFGLQRVNTPESMRTDQQKWSSLSLRVKNGEMPPKGAPAPTLDLREQFTDWVETTLRSEACADGISAGPRRSGG